ncbi:TerD domain-containing protein [Tepidibacter formicigenes DSM 15518]|jgi:tellurium resistance protein TerD|uniref:TerD domain-containing protein n=1 Tax=Tepidibacter formicigenes DSM 15518 TaxID=1123349 RepID=A0A1M6U251_9FIRM|nr:TerD domain-containing protein [Tepidibacter formicigenes DSM 15518]
MPSRIHKVGITVTIHDAIARAQNFGQVSNAYVRVVDVETDKEIMRYDLGEEFSIETALIVCELYRHNGEWKFSAVGSGFEGGLRSLCINYGLDVN